MNGSWSPGWQCGPDGRYELLSYLTTGGEGEVWRATRLDHNGRRYPIALKIKNPGTEDDRRRWEDARHRAAQLRVDGLLAPTDCFLGPAPHPAGTTGAGTAAYQVTPWLGEAEPILHWAERQPVAQRLEALAQVCRILDGVHDQGYVHRDISGGNVMVDPGGRVTVIDLTALGAVEHTTGLARVATPGFHPGQSEAKSEAVDCYAVGALVHRLLLPGARRLDSAQHAASLAHEALVAAGYPVVLADELVRALDRDPELRPRPLTPWARRLTALLAVQEGERTGVSLFTDVRGRPVIVSCGPAGVHYQHEADYDRLNARLPSRSGGPRGVREVATARGGDGRVAVAALTVGGALHLGTEDGWRQVAESASGVAVLASPQGDVLAFAASPGELVMTRSGSDARLAFAVAGRARVLAAAWDDNGDAAVLVREAGRLAHWRWPLKALPSSVTVCELPVASAAICPGPWDELQAVVVGEDGSVRWWAQHSDGVWEPASGPDASRAQDVALLSVRGGLCAAWAGPEGVWVSTPSGTSHLATAPASRVSIAQGSDWRLSVAALTGGEPACWQESWDSRWYSVRR
ncbi:serine/threonine protein kinase [Nonomuraea sp. NPDC002799]